MVCDFCGKRKATIHLIKIVDNKVEKIKLCENCAEQISLGSQNDILEGIAELLIRLFETRKKDSSSEEKVKETEDKKKKCANCGIDLGTIKKKGKVGCAECYRNFSDVLLPLIKTIHGSIEYRGKVPFNSNSKFKVEKRIRDLKWRLDEAVIIENFEEAAKLRDRINRLQKKLYARVEK